MGIPMTNLRKALPIVAAGVALVAFASMAAAEESAVLPEALMLRAPYVKVAFDGPANLQLNVAEGQQKHRGDRSQVTFQVTGNMNATVTVEPGGRRPFIRVPGAGHCLARAVGVEPTNKGESIGYNISLKFPGRQTQTVGIDTDCPGGPTPAIKLPLFGKARTGVLAIESRNEWNTNDVDLSLPGKYVGSIMLTVTAD
jgi:hypothetical protein